MKTHFPPKLSLNSFGTARHGSLFFLHANSYSAALYQPFLQSLADSYKILAPDLPGHGQSRWVGQIQEWQSLADYFTSYLEKNPPSGPIVGMGHSIGGILIMLMAVKHPEWFSKLILLDPVLLPRHIIWIMHGLKLASLTHLIPLAKAAKRRRSLFPSRQAALDHYSAKKVFTHWEPQFLEAYVDSCLHPLENGEMQLSCAPQLESSIYESLPLNSWRLPKQLRTPSLFMIGKYSDTVNRRGVHRLQKLGGNHVVKSIAGGHLFPFEQSGACMALIKDFLET